jgi:small subunit ribosomal protein S13
LIMVEQKEAKKTRAKEKHTVGGKPQHSESKPEVDSGIVQLVRVSGVVVDGNLDLTRALMKIKGIGRRTATSMVQLMGYDIKTKIGGLNEEQIAEVEKQIEKTSEILPDWMLNRRRDKEVGKDLHLTGSDLDLRKREDVNLEKKIKSYRGVRYALNLPVRGQRTKSSFRTGTTIGVSRKKAQIRK